MRNNFEKQVAVQLGQSYQYEAIKLGYVIHHHYIPDFTDLANKQIVEAKGRFVAEDRRKILAVKAQHPDWSIKMVFVNPHQTLSKASRTTYAVWCERNGIAWEQGPAPTRTSIRKNPK